MCDASEIKKYTKPRVLLASQRNIHAHHFRCANYEFEGIIHELDSVEFLSPQPSRWFEYRSRIANRLARSCAIPINPGIPKTKIQQSYDLFFAVCTFPKDLLNFMAIAGWRDHCKTSICYLNEIWVAELYKERCLLKILSKFDYVIVNCSQSVDALNEVIGRKCFHLPPGIDAILFCPYPEVPQRIIDVYSIGRKSEVTHRSLMRMVEEDNIFYVYDTRVGSQVFNTDEHRLLLANMAKRSRYFIVNPGHIDRPDRTGGQSEISFRYFEGAASGTIMIGEHPKSEEFGKLFNWPGAVIHLPFGSDKIETIINDLDRQPDRQEKIRRNNMVQSLLRHDWVYRWETILQTAGLKPMPEVLERKKRLRDVSSMIEKRAVGLGN